MRRLGTDPVLRALLERGFEEGAWLAGPAAAYGPVVVELLADFLGRLPPQRRERVMSEQLGLSVEIPAEERLVRMLRHSPVLHKLGQVLARDRRLSAGLRRHLEGLESLRVAVDPREIGRVAAEGAAAWGRERGRVVLGGELLAEGSVAWVIPISWRPGAGKETVAGVIKLLKPGVQERLLEDLEALAGLGETIADACIRAGRPPLDYESLFETVRELLSREVDFRGEQENLVRAAAQYRGESGVRVPALWEPLCTPGCTAMERLDGVKVTAAEGLGGMGPAMGWGAATVDAVLGVPWFSAGERAWIHGDPHAGNLWALGDGRLGLLDWSLAVELTRRRREDLVGLLLAAWLGEVDGVLEGIGRMASGFKPTEAVCGLVRAALEGVAEGGLPGPLWVVRLLDDLVLRGGVRLDGEGLLLRKVVHTLEGVHADLVGAGGVAEASAGLDGVLLRRLILQLGMEWPWRAWAAPGDRRFRSGLSNLDLTRAWAGGVSRLARGWVWTRGLL